MIILNKSKLESYMQIIDTVYKYARTSYDSALHLTSMAS